MDFLKRYFRSPRVSVVFHIFYEDVALEVIARLKNCHMDHEIYISHSHDLSREIMAALDELTVPIHLLQTDNIGMDVYPFLAMLEHFSLYDAGIICKLHTKRGEGVIGETWKSELFDSILGDGSRLALNVELMEENPQLLLLGAESTYLSAHKAMKGNFHHIFEINRSSLYADLRQDWGFFAGTIFLARSKIFKSLPPASMIRQSFAMGATQGDGEYAHACERLFGLLPRLFLGQVATIPPPVRGNAMAMNPPPSPRLISQIMTDLHTASQG